MRGRLAETLRSTSGKSRTYDVIFFSDTKDAEAVAGGRLHSRRRSHQGIPSFSYWSPL